MQRRSRLHVHMKAINLLLRGLQRDLDPGLVIPEGFHGASNLFRDLAFETSEPQKIHLTFFYEIGGQSERRLDILEDLPLQTFHNDLDRFTSGCGDDSKQPKKEK